MRTNRNALHSFAKLSYCTVKILAILILTTRNASSETFAHDGRRGRDLGQLRIRLCSQMLLPEQSEALAALTLVCLQMPLPPQSLHSLRRVGHLSLRQEGQRKYDQAVGGRS